MSLKNMCRLCLSENNLVWVFDRRFENSDNMKNVIFITTGVEISTTDEVSQSICEICCRTSLSMFEFRKKCLESDRYSKEQLNRQRQISIPPLPNEVQIKEEPEVPPEATKLFSIHSTVKELYELHPHIKLPRICLTSNIKPFVTLPMGEVENYFKQRNLNFSEHSKLALRPRSTARKKTYPSSNVKYSSPLLIRGQIVPQEVENSETGALLPIKIKIIPNVPSDNKRPPEVDVQHTDATPCHKKRKYADAIDSPTKENEVPRDTNHATTSMNDSTSVSYVAKVSQPLFICDICYVVHSNREELEDHRHKHLRCQFCKSLFRSFQDRFQHLQGECIIKEASTNIPSLELPRVETNSDIVNKYPEAFLNFPSATSEIECHEILSDYETESSEASKPSKVVNNTEIDVIEILSDDEDIPTNNKTPRKEPRPSKVPKLLTRTIKPNVTIKDSPIAIPANLNDLLTLKDLMISSDPSITSTEVEVQTADLSHSTIKVNNVDQTAMLTNLKEHMRIFRIPVVIKKGPFNVLYKQMNKQSKSKTLRLWDDLVAVDVQNRNKPDKQVEQDVTPSSASPPVSSAIAPTRIAEEVDDCILVTEDSTDDNSKTSRDENCNSISNSASTNLATITSTYNHVTTAMSSGVSTSLVASTSSAAQPSSSANTIVSDVYNSNSKREKHPKALVHWLPSVTPTDRAVSRNTFQPKLSEDPCTYPTSEAPKVSPNPDCTTATSKDKRIGRPLRNTLMTTRTVSSPSYSIPLNASDKNVAMPLPVASTSPSNLCTFSVSETPRILPPAIHRTATSKGTSNSGSSVHPRNTLSVTSSPSHSIPVNASIKNVPTPVPVASTSPSNLCTFSVSETPRILPPAIHTTATSKGTSDSGSSVHLRNTLPATSSPSRPILLNMLVNKIPSAIKPVPTVSTAATNARTYSISEVPSTSPSVIHTTATFKETSNGRSTVNPQVALPTISPPPYSIHLSKVANNPSTIKPVPASASDFSTYSISEVPNTSPSVIHATATFNETSNGRFTVNPQVALPTISPPPYSIRLSKLANNPSTIKPVPAVSASASNFSTYSISEEPSALPSVTHTTATIKETSNCRSSVNPQMALPTISPSPYSIHLSKLANNSSTIKPVPAASASASHFSTYSISEVPSALPSVTHTTATIKETSNCRSSVDPQMTLPTIPPPPYSIRRSKLANNPSTIKAVPAVSASASNFSTYSISEVPSALPTITHTTATIRESSNCRSSVNLQATLPTISPHSIQLNKLANNPSIVEPMPAVSTSASDFSIYPIYPTIYTSATSKDASIGRSLPNPQMTVPAVSPPSFSMQPNTSANIVRDKEWSIPADSVLNLCTSPVSEVATPTISHSPNTSATVSNVPGTVRPVSATFRKPKAPKGLRIYKIGSKLSQKSKSTSGNTRKNHNIVGQTSSFSNDLPRPPTPFVAYENRKTTNDTSRYANQQFSIASVSESFALKDNSYPDIAVNAGVSPNLSRPENASSLESTVTSRNSTIGFQHTYSHYSGSLPYAVKPPSYLETVASKRNVLFSTVPKVTYSPVPEKYFQEPRYPSVSALKSTSQIPLLPTTPPVTPKSCSPTSPKTGQIRVRNLQELT